MKILILGGDTAGECEAGCGEDWAYQEAINLASERIKERFGEDISLDYIDLSSDSAEINAREWKKMIKNRNLTPPLLLLNGELRISGQFDIRQLLDVIEVEREVGNYNGGKK